MEDNLDIFKRVMFNIPGERDMVVLTIGLGVVLGSLSTWLLSPASNVRANIVGGIVISLFFYVIPGIVSGELIVRLGEVTRRWTYLISVIDQIVVFLFSFIAVVADSILMDNAQEAWQLLWLGVATVFAINIVMLMGARSNKNRLKSTLLAVLFPGILLVAFHVFIGQLVGIPRTLYMQNSVLFVISALLLLLTFGMYDFIIRANVDNISAMDFPSVIILGGEKEFSGGITTDVFHQVLHIKQTEGEEIRYNIPWVHPGPVEGFGGGRLTEKLIDGDTFFLHIPSDHSLDMAVPDDIEVFQDMPTAILHKTATELVSVEREGFTLWGRRYGFGEEAQHILYLQNRDLDDYDPGIIRELKNTYENVCFIDLHNQTVMNTNPRLQAIDPRADTLRELVDELMQRLAEAQTGTYRAGFAGGTEYRCLVEEVNGQTSCLLGIDGNDAPQVLHEVEDELQTVFDETLVYTTDSHKRLIELAAPKDYDFEKLVRTAKKAREKLSPASAGIGETEKRVTVLGEQYNGMIFTLNIMARLIPISLLLYYIGLAFLIL